MTTSAQIERFNIFADSDGDIIAESHHNGDFVKASDAPTCQRVAATVFKSGTWVYPITFEDDEDGEWVRFENIS